MRLVLLALGALALLAAPAAAPGSLHAVAIQGFAFDPDQLTIAAGDAVTWTNFDTAPHSVYPEFQAWNSDDLHQGDQFTRVFADPGMTFYRCGVHPNMRAWVLALPALP